MAANVSRCECGLCSCLTCECGLCSCLTCGNLKRTVMKVNLECYKCRRVAMQSIAQIEGIDMVSYNKKEQTITVEGDADPVCIAKRLKKKFKCVTIISVNKKKKPPPPPQPPPPPSPPPPPPPPCCCCFCYIFPVPTPCTPCKPVQPCCCSDCSSRREIPRTGCHPSQAEVYYVYEEENPNLCTIS